MPPPQEDFWLAGLMVTLAAASLATWVALIRRMKHGPILRFEPRQPVPWSGAAALLAAGFVAMVLADSLFGGNRAASEGELKPQQMLERMGQSEVFEVGMVGVVLAAVVVLSGATTFDLGLPESMGGLLCDVRIGVVAWLAALVPVYGTQLVLVLMFGEPSQHPLIQMVTKEPNGLVLVAAFFAAVVVAPICEEIMFRLLLLGWLEKWEDARLGWRATVVAPIEVESASFQDEVAERVEPPLEACVGDDVAVVDAVGPQSPPQRGLLGLPHGWLPILVSSTLFALAHFGNGPDPIPLFLLALVLGYTYQRTHRIVPCMVAHALFNSLTLIALWRMLWTGEPVGP
jgi:membrane protease YdiL (CAAX protease family)